MENQVKWHQYLNNWLSIGGSVAMISSIVAGLIMYIADLLLDQSASYQGLLYMLLWIFFAIGFLLMVAGALRKRHLIKNQVEHHLQMPDISTTRGRVIAFFILQTILVIVIAAGVGTYTGIHYVESDEFCTEACHTVMSPEGRAHPNSAHAMVNCVDCHVGSGAGSFLEAKINGMTQVLHLLQNSYPRPIPTPLHAMRSSKEICESCHWRDNWIGVKEKHYTYFSAEEEDNDQNKLRMLFNIGGVRPGTNKAEGIHQHMLKGRTIEYIARDEKRQEIVYVRVKQDGKVVKEYNHTDEPLTDEERSSLEPREMDCMDCHNRPAHQFKPPMQAINTAMASGVIDPEIPNIKQKGMALLSKEYKTKKEAVSEFQTLPSWYKENHPDFEDSEKIDEAVTALTTLYHQNFDPEMKVSWKAYPDHIGHLNSPGCFRCHNETLESEEGDIIFDDCSSCHTILAQGFSFTKKNNGIPSGEVYYHVTDDEEFEEFTNCNDCHDGGPN